MKKGKIKGIFFTLSCITCLSILLIFLISTMTCACAQNLQCAQGYGLGRGMQRGYGSGYGMGPGFGQGPGRGQGRFGDTMWTEGRGGRSCPLDSQQGILSEPSYCRMLMNRPDLNLSSEQKEALRNLQIKHTKETSDLRSDLQIKKIELRKLRFDKNPDFNKLKGILENISKLQLDLQISRLKLQLAADKVLTEEQKNSLYLSPDMAVDVEWEDEISSDNLSK